MVTVKEKYGYLPTSVWHLDKKHPELAKRYQVMALPSYVVDEEHVKFKAGVLPEKLIKEFYK